MERAVLARIIGGDLPSLPGTADIDAIALLEAAHDEGVVALVNRWLCATADIDLELLSAFSAPARDLAVKAMFLEAECRRVLAVLGAAEIRVLLLKGSALAYWLYPTPYLRDCADIDLLFRTREDAERAAELLRDHGYGVDQRAADLAYEMPCHLRGDGVRNLELDIHWRLSNAPVFAETLAFGELYERAIALPRLGTNARGLSPTDALAHACMHRALNLFFEGRGDRLKWMYDIHLLVSSLAPRGWETFIDLCRDRGLSGVCHDGLEAAVAVFGTKLPAGALAKMAVARTRESLDAKRLRSWTYLHYRNLTALPDTRTRIRWVRQQVFVPLSTMRRRYGGENDSLWLLHWQRLGRASRHLAAWVRSRARFKRPAR